MENENFVLRDKLSKVRDELAVATTEITSMAGTLETKESILKENLGDHFFAFNKVDFNVLICLSEKIANLEANLEELNAKNVQIQTEKEDVEEKFKEFSNSASKKIEKLKVSVL